MLKCIAQLLDSTRVSGLNSLFLYSHHFPVYYPAPHLPYWYCLLRVLRAELAHILAPSDQREVQRLFQEDNEEERQVAMLQFDEIGDITHPTTRLVSHLGSWAGTGSMYLPASLA